MNADDGDADADNDDDADDEHTLMILLSMHTHRPSHADVLKNQVKNKFKSNRKK